MKNICNFWIMTIIIFSLSSCTSFTYQVPDYEKIADQITEKTTTKLAEQKNLVLVGTGGQMMNDIQMMAMSFNYYHEVDLKQARKLIVYAIDEYLSDINNNEEVRLYLHEYPFTAKNIEINIFVYNPDKSRLSPEKIYLISSVEGKVNYYVRDADSRKAICKETYEEASELDS